MHSSISKKILAWYQKYQRDLPWRKYKNQKDRHYKVLLSEFMLQQTQVKTALPFFNNFYKKINSLEKLSKTSQAKVNKLWQGLGYYRRAKFLLETSKIIKKKYNYKLPSQYEDLIALPGIGDYTAKAILSIAYDKNEIGIDGNVERVVTRIFNISGKKKILKYVERLKVEKKSSFLMQGLMELGALICKPKLPLCSDCFLNKNCKYSSNKKFNLDKKVKAEKKIKKFIAIIFRKNKKILLRYEKNLGPLKEFLNVPLVPEISQEGRNYKKILKKNKNYQNLGILNISISNFKAEILCLETKKMIKVNRPYYFMNATELKSKFISSFLKKILKKIKFIK